MKIRFQEILTLLTMLILGVASSVKEIDNWLMSQNLNQFGDPFGTVYMGGDPLFDEFTGQYTDRYTYLTMKFPSEPWKLDINGLSYQGVPGTVDKWLSSQNLNEFGDPSDTVYAGGGPLFDEVTGEFTDRFTYLKNKFPSLPWESGIQPKQLRRSVPKKVDEWLVSKNLNQFGDPLNTMYTGGDPLFDELTGEYTDRYTFLENKFPSLPWESGIQSKQLRRSVPKEVDEWLVSKNLNQFGDPLNTMYTGGDPLFDELTGEFTDRLTYLENKFPSLPWVHKLRTPYMTNSMKEVDEWLASKNLNEFGDPLGTVYTGGDPLFDEITGLYTDRYTYLKMKFPSEPWKYSKRRV